MWSWRYSHYIASDDWRNPSGTPVPHLPVEFHPGLFPLSEKRPSGKPELGLVGLDHMSRRQAMAILILGQVAV
jgi:hypothetical protein